MFRRILIAVAAVVVLVPLALYGWTRISPHEIRTQIEIDAAPEQVWKVLTDFDAYEQWNPFIVSAKGDAREGATLTNKLKSDGEVTTFEPTVLVAKRGRELRWIGRFGVPGIGDGEHYFRLEDAGNGRTRLVQGETFTGVLVPFAGGLLQVEDEFAAMNKALKERVESIRG
jgi:hypothetical protein